MEVIPAIDLRGGQCVRLYQGDFSRETAFSADPLATALRWQEQGAPRLHVVDLDGARSGRPAHLGLIGRMIRALRVPVQAGGGLRTLGAVHKALALGVDRAILGTAAVEDEALIEAACARFGERIIVGIDAREGLVAVRGWRKGTGVPALELAARAAGLGARRIIYTDISRDGTLAGPNLEAIAQMVARPGLAVIASGGVSSLEHLRKLAEIGVEAAIVGRALYTGEVDLRAAVAALAGPAGGGRAFPYRFDVRRMEVLESPERAQDLPAEQVLALLPLEPHHVVADIGCGPGFFTLPLARRLPQGRVYALDVQPEMVARCRERVREAGLANVRVEQCGELDFPVPPSGEGLDGAFLGFVLHEMAGQREPFLRAVKALLKPGGWLGILEWAKTAPSGGGPPRADRIAQGEARELVERVGLKVVGEEGLGERYYFLLLEIT